MNDRPLWAATCRILLAGILCLSFAHSSLAEVYRWKDADGNYVFSDKPQAGAERIELHETTIVPALETAPLSEPTPAPLSQVLPYGEVVIANPPDQTTLHNQPVIDVTVASDPPLQTEFGHQMQLYLDGKPYGAPGGGAQFILQNVDRGTHTLAAVILDESGTEAARSNNSVFHLQKTSVKNRPKNRPVKPK